MISQAMVATIKSPKLKQKINFLEKCRVARGLPVQQKEHKTMISQAVRNKVSIIMTGYLDRMSVLHIHMCDMM